jgi:hypothetical protein
MTGYLDPARQPLILNVERLARRRELTREFLDRVDGQQRYDRETERLVMTLHADVYAERLPSQQHRITVTDPRWATWWDHLKATYRHRWWAQWWVRRYPPRTVDTPITATFNVRAAWRYPDTPHLRPGLGTPVLWTATTPVTPTGEV